jgi:alanine racemase
MVKAKDGKSSSFLERWKRAEAQGEDSSLLKNSSAPSMDHSRLVAELSAAALRANYLAIRDQVSGLSILPMVKANAYGHGSVWAARQLLDLPDLYALGVATLDEGAELRKELGAAGRRTKIMIFSGIGSWTDQVGQICEKYHLTPVISSESDWNAFWKNGWAEKLPYELKFNTGMNRLGIPVSLAGRISRQLAQKSAPARPEGILSHLAMAESPDARLSQAQKERFIALRSELSGILPSTHFHLGNSAAIWNQKQWGLTELTDVVRPGISLYGVPPWAGAPARGIAPVMTLRARIMAIHRLKPGEGTGYGARFKVRGNQAASVAILGAGYGDGIHRMLSGNENSSGGHVWVGDRPQRILGTVSMDLCAVSCTTETQVGDWVEFMGARIEPWVQSSVAGTIPYELLTSVSPRVKRIYV